MSQGDAQERALEQRTLLLTWAREEFQRTHDTLALLAGAARGTFPHRKRLRKAYRRLQANFQVILTTLAPPAEVPPGVPGHNGTAPAPPEQVGAS